MRKVCRCLYRLLTGFVVIWLAVFYPALCEYHGLMLPFGPDSMAQMHDDQMQNTNVAKSMAVPVHSGMDMQMPNMAHSISKASTFVQHSRVALTTVAMSFLTIAAPTGFNIRLAQQQSSFVVAEASIAHQCSLLLPDQPPRFLPLT